jgi:hypothetical protein
VPRRRFLRCSSASECWNDSWIGSAAVIASSTSTNWARASSAEIRDPSRRSPLTTAIAISTRTRCRCFQRKGIPAALFVVTDHVGTRRIQVHDKLYLLLARRGGRPLPKTVEWNPFAGSLHRQPLSCAADLARSLAARAVERLTRSSRPTIRFPTSFGSPAIRSPGRCSIESGAPA